MAGRFMKIFFNTEKLAEANRKYQAGMSRIEERQELTEAAIKEKREAAKAQFRNTMEAETEKLKAAWSK